MTTIEAVTVTRAACPQCTRLITITKSGQMRAHGPQRGDGATCPGSQATVGYRYRVTDSTIERVPPGSHLIYAKYRGEADQQDLINVLEGTHDGGWCMEFMDVGLKFDGRWFDLLGRSEKSAASDGRDGASEVSE